MKKTATIKVLSLILCTVLIAATVLTASGCSGGKTVSTDIPENAVSVGDGSNRFYFKVTGISDSHKAYEVHTDEKTVGTALEKLGLISGDEGEFGLYVKTVDGETLDYDTQKLYWAFYAKGEYGLKSAELTEIEQDAVYEFKAE